METKNIVTIESYLASICGSEKGIQYTGKIIQERDKLIEALNSFKGNAKDINFLKGDIAEVWQGGYSHRCELKQAILVKLPRPFHKIYHNILNAG